MSYKKWITVNLRHSYFADGKCPKLLFEPTGDCREQMRRGKQFFYPRPNGFMIFRDTDLKKQIQSGSAANCFFDAAVYSADPLFGNYSNLEIDYRQGRVYYIGNTLKNPPGQSNEKTLTMTDTQSGKEIEAVPVLLKPKYFFIPLDNTAPGDTFRLLDKTGAVVKEHTVVKESQAKDKNNGKSLYVDLKGKSAGIYSLEINHRVTAYFYADDRLYYTKPVLIIAVDVTGAGGRKMDDTEVLNYVVQAAGRSVTWQYHVISQENRRKLDDLEIRNNSEKIMSGATFERVRIDEERKEAVFVSNRSIPLSERPVQSIELMEKGSGAPLISHLPNADLSSLHVIEGKWVAKINVYI